MNLANLVNVSGANINDFVASVATAKRYRKKEAAESAEEVRQNFKQKLDEAGKEYVVHFDMKCVSDFTGKSMTAYLE